MISRFRHKGLERFFKAGDYRGIPAHHTARIERMLDRLDSALRASDMNLPGYRFHPLTGQRKGTYAASVAGNWRMTFRFEGENAVDADLEDYH